MIIDIYVSDTLTERDVDGARVISLVYLYGQDNDYIVIP